MNAELIWWTSNAVMWAVTLWACISGWHWRRKLSAATSDMRERLDATTPDHVLATWCRQTNLTVIAVTGTEFTISLADLANSPHPYRSWNVPVSAAIWSAKDLTPPTPEEARV